MIRRLWRWFYGPCGPLDLFIHLWTYDESVLDSLGQPIRRHCPACRLHMERRYNGYDVGAYGSWEKVE